MLKLAPCVCATFLALSASAQGLVNFFNNSSTLISVMGYPMPAVANHYYFALLTGPANSTDFSQFTFSGVVGANQAVAGRFTGGAGLAVLGWAPGTTRAFQIFCWSAWVGSTFNPAWLQPVFPGGPPVGPPGGYWGLSAIAPSGTAGGPTATGTLPPLNIFGGTEGFQSGFNIGIPEPATGLVLSLGAGLLVLLRRRT